MISNKNNLYYYQYLIFNIIYILLIIKIFEYILNQLILIILLYKIQYFNFQDINSLYLFI